MDYTHKRVRHGGRIGPYYLHKRVRHAGRIRGVVAVVIGIFRPWAPLGIDISALGTFRIISD